MKKPEQLKEPIALGCGLADARIDECIAYVSDQFEKGHSIKMTIINPENDPYNFALKYGTSFIVEDPNKNKNIRYFVVFKPLSGNELQEFKGMFLEDIFRFYNFD